MKNQYLIRIEYWNMWQPLHVPRNDKHDAIRSAQRVADNNPKVKRCYVIDKNTNIVLYMVQSRKELEVNDKRA